MSSQPSSPTGQSIARKTAHGILWHYLSFGLGKGLVFLTTAILARLLTPEDFGIVALATLAVTYLMVLKDFGLGAALIQRRQNVEEAANTIFTLNLLVGIALTLITIAIAPLVAVYFEEPLVTPILRWLGLTFVLNALSAVHIVRLQRELAFSRKLVPDLGRSAVKGVVSIGCALTGFGVWSLVIGQLAGVLAALVLAWVVLPWRPRLVINFTLAGRLLSYGLSIMGLQALAALEDNLDYLIIGSVFGNTALGIYTLAYRLPELLGLTTLWVIAAALFPAYASIQNRPDILRRGFLTTLRFIEMLSVPISLGLLIAADPLVRVAFGEQWLAAIPVVRVLALFVLVTSIGFNVGDIYKAIGRPDILIKLSVLKLTLLIPALWYGTRFGLVGVAIGHLIVSLLHGVVRLWVTTRFVEVTIGDILLQIRPSFLSGLGLMLLAWPALYLTAGAAPLLRLIVTAAAGGVGYLLVLWLLEREWLLEMAQKIGVPGAGKKPTTPALVFNPSSDEGS